MLPANAVLALFATAFLTANWIHYGTQYRRHKKRIKKKKRSGKDDAGITYQYSDIEL